MSIDGDDLKNKDMAEFSPIIKQLLLEAKDVKEEDFNKWYEKKKKVFNTGIKKSPSKEEFIKFLNYALNFSEKELSNFFYQ